MKNLAIPLAILLVGILIGLAILFHGRYQFVSDTHPNSNLVLREDTLTGKVEVVNAYNP